MGEAFCEGGGGWVRDIQKTILIFMFIIDGTHECGSGRKDFIDEDEDGLFGGEFDAFADDIAELSDCQVGGDEVLLLVDDGDI